eukprot:m51a1_g3761 hypothetical protein (142) ;mRNA; f:114592-115017
MADSAAAALEAKELKRERQQSRVRTPGKRPPVGGVSSTSGAQGQGPDQPPQSLSPKPDQQQQQRAEAAPQAAEAAQATTVPQSVTEEKTEETTEDDASREKRNWQLHMLYTKKDFRACTAMADTQLQEHPKCEYALYIKGK